MPATTLLSFRAGKMTRENDTSNNVVPDLRKGYVQLLTEDELLHFQWKERSAAEAEDDLIIFPEDAKFVRVTEAEDGRVYMLRFESSKAKHFFWMQDKSDAKDIWLVERVNTLIDDPDAPAEDMPNGAEESNAMADVLTGSNAHNPRNPTPPAGMFTDELLNSTLASIPGGAEAFWDGMQGSGIGREELLQMLASEMQDPSISVPQTPSASQQPPLFPQSSQAQTSSQQTSSLPPDLAAQLASISGGLPGASGARGLREPTTSLSDVLDRNVLSRVLEMPGIGERLRPGLPDNWDEDGSSVGEAVQSPQFQQALGSFSHAISTGQLAPLLQQFGLSGNIDSAEGFFRAVEEQVRREQGGEGGQSGEGHDDDDRMQED